MIVTTTHISTEADSTAPTERRRVLHLITRMIRGGADENTLATVRGLDPAVYDVHLAVGAESELCAFEIPRHVVVHEVPSLVRRVAPVQDARAMMQLTGLMRTHRFDLVHTHTAKAGVLGRLAASVARTPVIVHTLHGTTFHEHVDPLRRFLYMQVERLAARCTDSFISVGEDVAARYVEAGVLPRGGYQTIYSGMPVERFVEARTISDDACSALRRACGVPPDAELVGVVARLEPRKGHTYLFDAIARLSATRPRLHLLVVGDGASRDALRRDARDLGIGDRVHFVGHRADVERYLSIVDVVALTSLWEGLPRVLVQTALVGKPAVTFDCEGAHEIIEDGRNGFVVPTGDVGRLAERLTMLLDGCEVQEHLEAHSQAIAERWSEERMIGDIDTLYTDLLKAA